MGLQIPVIVKSEEGQEYIKCVKCKTDKMKRDFRHTLMGRTLKKMLCLYNSRYSAE